jgi:hypothetical protein
VVWLIKELAVFLGSGLCLFVGLLSQSAVSELVYLKMYSTPRHSQSGLTECRVYRTKSNATALNCYAIPTVSQLRTGLKEVKSKVVESDPSAAMPQIRMMLAIVNLSLAGEEPVAICSPVPFFLSGLSIRFFLGDWSDTNIADSACDHIFDHAGKAVRDEIYFRFKIVALFQPAGAFPVLPVVRGVGFVGRYG